MLIEIYSEVIRFYQNAVHKRPYKWDLTNFELSSTIVVNLGEKNYWKLSGK